MTRSTEEIVEIYHRLHNQRSPVINQMEKFSNAYNGALVLPLPEIDEMNRPAVANLLAQGLDATAQRVASVLPTLSYPQLKDGRRNSANLADMRRRVNQEWWDANRMGIKLRKRARFLIGNGTSPALIRPDFKKEIPSWRVISPLSVYPAPTEDLDDITPAYAIVGLQHSLGWLQQHYPAQVATLYKGGKATNHPEAMFDLIEYVDDSESVLIAIGAKRDTAPADSWGDPSFGASAKANSGSAPFHMLERIPNRAGICPLVMPGRLTLDKIQGQFDQLLGIYEMQAALTALNYLSIKRSIFPDTYLVGKEGGTPAIIQHADGLIGQMGIVQNGMIQPVNQEPGMQTGPTIDRLERAMRVGGDIPSEMSGESGSNIRTARRGNAVLSSAIDFPNQEYQEIIADSLQAENVIGIAIVKKYWGSKSISLYTSRSAAKDGPKYIPNEVFETDRHYVKYSFPGTDMNGLVISMGQRVGIGEMSIQTAMEMDPMIEDPVREKNRVTDEALEKALLGGIQQGLSQGTMTPADGAQIIKLVGENKMSLADATTKVHEAAQKRQATQVPPGAPAAQPGLAQPGQGAEQPTIGAAPGGAQNFQQLLASLRGPSNQSAAETAPGGAP